jgi:hypothetical protein
MHYTEGFGRKTIGSGVYEHEDQSLPGTPGTSVSAEMMNAFMYEMVNIVTYAGLTVKSTAAADRSSGFIQVRDAIFSSAKIDTAALAPLAVTDAKINDVSLTKFTDGTVAISTIDGTHTDTMDMSRFGLKFTYDLNADFTQYYVQLGQSFIDVKQRNAAGSTNYRTEVFSDRITKEDFNTTSITKTCTIQAGVYDSEKSDTSGSNPVTTSANFSYSGMTTNLTDIGTPANNRTATLGYILGLKFENSTYGAKFAVFDMGSSWSGGAGGPYTAQVGSGLPNTYRILGMSFNYEISATGNVFEPTTAILSMQASSPSVAGEYNAVVTSVDDLTSGYTRRYLTVWYSEA